MADENKTNPPSIFAEIANDRLELEDYTASVSEIVSTIPVRKPSAQEFFRVSPDPALSLVTTVYFDKSDMDKAYLVAPNMRGSLAEDARLTRLVVYATRRGATCIWPMALPTDDNASAWVDTRLEAVRRAKERWVRIRADMHLGAYRIYEAQGDIGEPAFPSKTLAELLEIGFKGRVIETEDHPIIKGLRGL